MQNLIFSFNATLPLVVVVALGILLKRIRLVNKEFGAQCDRLVFRVALPVTLFSNMYFMDIRSAFDGRFVGFCAIATILSIAGVWIGGSLALRGRKGKHGRRGESGKKEDLGELVQASYRGSIAVLGNALLSNIYGSSAMAPLMILGSVPLSNIAACLILAMCAPDSDDDEERSMASQLKKGLKGVASNPIILGIIAGCICSLARFHFPQFIEASVRSVSSLTTPLSLLSIGFGFKGREALGRLQLSGAATIMKLLVIPAVFVPAAVCMGFRGEALIAILIMLGSPSTPSCYTMARNYGYEGVISASAVVLTMLGSAFSVTLGILVLRTMGLV
jgi:predicted permease